MPTFAFYQIPQAGEPTLSLAEAESPDAAKALAVETIKQGVLSAIRLWDGGRVIEVRRPVPVAPASEEAEDADDRAARMIVMKAEGKTLRQIGTTFGISVDRVRQVMARAQSRAKMHATEPNRAALSVRARNVLMFLIAEPETDRSERDRLLPERVAALTYGQILDAPNAGLRTIAELEAWLWDHGLTLSNES